MSYYNVSNDVLDDNSIHAFQTRLRPRNDDRRPSQKNVYFLRKIYLALMLTSKSSTNVLGKNKRKI